MVLYKECLLKEKSTLREKQVYISLLVRRQHPVTAMTIITADKTHTSYRLLSVLHTFPRVWTVISMVGLGWALINPFQPLIPESTAVSPYKA